MKSFSAEDKVRFRYKKYVKEHIPDFFISLLLHTALTEAVVYLCGGTAFWKGFALALAYTAGKWLYELHYYKKEWLDVDITD